MRFILVPHNETDINEGFEIGLRDFFIDFEYGATPQGKSIEPPHNFLDFENLRNFSPDINIFLRPDGDKIRNQEYAERILELNADFILFPKIENISSIKRFSESFHERGSRFIGMIESQQGLDKLDDFLAIETVNGVYLGLHDLSKSLGYESAFEASKAGYLDKLAEHAFKANKPFGFTGISPAMSDEMIFSLIKEHARLGSTMTLAPIMRLRQIGQGKSLEQAVSLLSDIYFADSLTEGICKKGSAFK